MTATTATRNMTDKTALTPDALKLFRRAAEQGNADAQNMLGFTYAEGRGVPQDDTEAVKWFRRAADQGHAKAQFHLGDMYAEGQGVRQDDTEAVMWYRRAADQGAAKSIAVNTGVSQLTPLLLLCGIITAGKNDSALAASILELLGDKQRSKILEAAQRAGVNLDGNGANPVETTMPLSEDLKKIIGAHMSSSMPDFVSALLSTMDPASASSLPGSIRLTQKTAAVRTDERPPIPDRQSWPAASDPVIETINRVLGGAGERFDGVALTKTETYFTAHFPGEGSRTRTDWCFWPKGEFFLTEIREPRSSVWDGRFGSIQGLELLEYNTNNGGRYKLKVFSSCGEDGIRAIVDLASRPFSRKAGGQG